MRNRFLGAVAMYVGTAVGAGIFAIPYAVSNIGFPVGVFYLLGIGGFMMIGALLYGEVILRTNGIHQMSFYAGRYLGRSGRILTMLSLVFGITGALTAYTIAVGHFLFLMLSPWLGGEIFYYRLGFFLIMSVALIAGLRIIEHLEQGMMILVLTVVTALAIIVGPDLQMSSLWTFPGSDYFLPYGVLLFAYAAASVIPDMKDLLSHQPRSLKSAIMIGSSIPIVIYLAFTAVVMAGSRGAVTESAIVGLAAAVGGPVLIVGSLLGTLTMSTSFLSLGHALTELYHRDRKFSKGVAWSLALTPPLLLTLLQLQSFVAVIAIVGAIMGGFDGIIILLMHRASKKRGERQPEYEISLHRPIWVLMMILFGGGLLFQLLSFLQS